MRLVLIDEVKPPTCLARTIYDLDGKTILTKGTLLNDCYINRLKELGIKSIYVGDGMARMEIDGMVSEEVRLLIIRNTRDALSRLRAGESPESRRIRRAVSYLIDEIMLNRELMVHLIDIFSLKDHTFRHSVNVCVLSLLAGLALGYNHEDLIKLGEGALLHDVGKVTVLDCIVNSKDVFATKEYQIIQRHAECGYKILVGTETLDISAAEIAWQHHERYNGTGYPMSLAGNDISEYARIIAVADVYDAVSTKRPYREGLQPHEALKAIEDGKGIEFDPAIVKAFISSLVPFPLGSHVILNNNCEGIVISIDTDNPARPRVQLLNDNGCEISGIKIVDLLQEQNFFIEKMANR